MILLEELNDAERHAVLDDTISPMHPAEIFKYAQAGTLFAAIGLRAEATLEGVTFEKLRADLTTDDLQALANGVAILRYAQGTRNGKLELPFKQTLLPD